MTANDVGIILIGLITGAMIYMAFDEYRRLPSGKTLPQEIAELAARDERHRIIELLEKDCHYAGYKEMCECGAPMPEQVDYIIRLIGGTND